MADQHRAATLARWRAVCPPPPTAEYDVRNPYIAGAYAGAYDIGEEEPMPKMRPLTTELKAALPTIQAVIDDPRELNDQTVVCKFFNPSGVGTWWILGASAVLPSGQEIPLTDPRAADAEDIHLFGMAELGDRPEWGRVSWNEMAATRGPFGLPMERDLYWQARPVKEVREMR